jgi:hypothetical protein
MNLLRAIPLAICVAALAHLPGTAVADSRTTPEGTASASGQATPCAYTNPPDAFPGVDRLAAKRVGCKKARRVASKVQAQPYKGTWNPPKRVRAGTVFRCSYRYVTVDSQTTYNRVVCKARGGRRVTMRLYA